MAYKSFFAIILLLSIIRNSYQLECYVCTNQEHNVEKCLNTIKTCEQGEDVCLTEIRWGSTPYWSQGAKKQFYISKRCSSKNECALTRQWFMPTCTHIWYEDWSCSDCCQGDRCNFYVFSGSNRVTISKISWISGTIVLLVRFFLNK